MSSLVQIETICAGGVVIGKDGKVLVVSQRGKSWSLPKGHIDEGEDLLTAAKREIYEESGVNDLKFVKELGSYKRSRNSVKIHPIRSKLRSCNLGHQLKLIRFL
jgi:ADP-ribose pyrophosphatase YjhB (NUDIX family)